MLRSGSDDLDLVVVVEQRGHLAGRGLVRRAARDVPAEHARGGEQQQQPEREQPSSNGEEQAWLGLGVGLGVGVGLGLGLGLG